MSDSMQHVILAATPADVEALLATRIREARTAKGWTQAELARRAGLAIATLARIEKRGQGQLSSLLRICGALGRLADFESVLRAPKPSTLEELRRQRNKP